MTAAPGTDTATATVNRMWELRREAEKRPWWHRPLLAVVVTLLCATVADPDLFPGGLAAAMAVFGVIAVVSVVAAVIAVRRSSTRGHTGNVSPVTSPGMRWWHNPVWQIVGAYTVLLITRQTSLADSWAVVVGVAVVIGVAVALLVPPYESSDTLAGRHMQNPPVLTSDATEAVEDGTLSPDVLELLVLQHHTGERRIAWCARVLDTSDADIRRRIARGRAWLELPATEVHDPAGATWVRLTDRGRAALGYVSGESSVTSTVTGTGTGGG